MTRRERLMATLQGKPVDRPAVNFQEVGGLSGDPRDPDPFNIYNDPSWLPLLKLADEHTDITRFASPILTDAPNSRRSEFQKTETYTQDGSRFTRTEICVGGRKFTSLVRRDPGVNTTWTLEHLLKDAEDLKAYLELPDEFYLQDADVSSLFAWEEKVGDKGVVVSDTGDPLCMAAELFSMEDYTIIALTEQELFTELLEKLSRQIYATTERVAREFPGRLWRIYGSEYASEPYLPPRLYKEYVVKYTGPMVEMVRKYGGYPRIHSHGRIKNILPYIIEMGAVGLDPIEPPNQGDVELSYVRQEYGKDMVLFGNLEITDIENMPTDRFEQVVRKALAEGTSGEGRGFVLMPSASPYGRTITDKVLANYETMVRLTEAMG